jgi:RNA polymerase sigma-70 factor (ECF subfamily)
MPPPLAADAAPPTAPAARVEAFVALLAWHQRRVQLFVGSLVHDPADADDVVQEAQLVLWREFDRFQPGTDFGAWACTVAFHQVMAWRKRRQRDRLVFSDAFLTAVAAELEADPDRFDARRQALAGCLAKLPAPARELVRRRYTDGQAVEAIAAATARTVEAVYRALSRARHLLHDCVTDTLAREGVR